MESQTWEQAQKWEHEWHVNQQFNTFNEEKKQYEYARLMGLNEFATNYYGIRGWDFGNRSVIDIGGGEVSMLLKSKACVKTVVDPLDYPEWVKMRYKAARIEFINQKAEETIQTVWPIDVDGPKAATSEGAWDIGLMYNCLQHTEDPEKICANLRRYAKLIYVFEWVDEGISPGHLQNLTEEKLNQWLGGNGKVGHISDGPMQGKYYVGIFKGNCYEENV